MDIEKTLEELQAKYDFDDKQLDKIRQGLEKEIDVSVYAKPEFEWSQMDGIRLGLENSKDNSVEKLNAF